VSQSESNNRAFVWAPRVVVAAGVLLAVSQANVQVFAKERLLDLGENSARFIVKQTEFARRGSIVSRDGRPLASDEEACVFGVFFERVPDSPAFFMELGRAAGVPPSELLQLKAAGVEKRFWPDPISRERARAAQIVKARWRADGVSVRATGKRIYPLREAAAGFVGYLRDGKPAAGLELGQSEHLDGENGLSVGLVDLQGNYLPTRIDPRSTARVDGEDVELTIDSALQSAAFSAVRDSVKANQADQGAAVVLDPVTGDVLAMASWPSIDPEYPSAPLEGGKPPSDFNPNYMAALEPGSTFKILTLALALERGVVETKDSISCTGAMPVWANHSVRCDLHGGTRAHGSVDARLAIAKSCNISAATWAMRIGHDEFVRFLDSSGLTKPTRLGLPLERGGEFHRNEFAKRLQLATFGFGQSLTCTPVGLASAYTALANGGVRMEPRLIKRVGAREVPVRRAGRLFSERSAEVVMGFMEAVVQSDVGTGKSLRIPGYRIAGKTGTAQKINPKTGTVEGGGYVSNFVGVVPADNPRALILVMIDNPKAGRYYGASVAGPVFESIARAAIRKLGIAPSPSPSPESERPVKTGAAGPKVSVAAAPSGVEKRKPSVTVEARPIRLKADPARGRVSP